MDGGDILNYLSGTILYQNIYPELYLMVWDILTILVLTIVL